MLARLEVPIQPRYNDDELFKDFVRRSLSFVSGALPGCMSPENPTDIIHVCELFTSHHDLSALINTLDNELEQVSRWFAANKLTLNIKNI